MLTGQNGILTRSAEASKQTMHTNVYEQLQLKVGEYFIEKNLDNVTEETLIEHLQRGTNPIIGQELGEEGSGKYQINVENLVGTKQEYGNGTASGSDTSTYKDVYILEKADLPSGSINSTKIAATTPIRIAVQETNTNETATYKVAYYGKTTSENLTLGTLRDVKEKTSANDNLDATVTTVDGKVVITTSFGTYYQYVEGEENDNPTWWDGGTDVDGNPVYGVSNDDYDYYYNSEGAFLRSEFIQPNW